MNSISGGVNSWPLGPLGRVPTHAAPQSGCVDRHLANRNEMRVSGSDSNALLFLLVVTRPFCSAMTAFGTDHQLPVWGYINYGPGKNGPGKNGPATKLQIKELVGLAWQILTLNRGIA